MQNVALHEALKNVDGVGANERSRVLQLLKERDRLEKINKAKTSYIDFVKAVWPEFIAGPHHILMAEAFERIVRGENTRLIINLAPRHTKSEFASWLLPAWFMGLNPTKKIIQASNTSDLAAGFGRRVRNLIDGTGVDVDPNDHSTGITYEDIFPKVKLAKDSQAAAGWHTNRGGEYYALGVTSKVTGKGADLFIIDDPHSEQEARQAETNPEVFDDVYEWYTSGPRQRLQPRGAIVLVQTRWSKRDLTGRVLKQMHDNTDKDGNVNGDKWEVINIPAIVDEGEETERPVWPGFWPLEELKSTKAQLPTQKWKAQYQQQPTSEEGAIIKREHWRKWGADDEACPSPQHQQAWTNKDPPACDYIIASWDTAMTKNERADYSAMTLWGIFSAEDMINGNTINNAILLSAYKARLEFPELKRRVKMYYEEDMPDTLLVENKGSGISLIQELRRTGVPVEDFSFGRGSRRISNDKVARANMVSDIFASGYVWAPERRFADEVATECAEFPNGEHDDYLDSTVQAMLRFRLGGFIRTQSDEEDDDLYRFRKKRKRYY